MLKNNFVISNLVTIKEALGLLERNNQKILYVVQNNRLIGTITDGDIRRYFLSGGSIEQSVANAANKNFKFLTKKNYVAAQKSMLDWDICSIPVVDKNFYIEYIYFLHETDVVTHRQVKMPVVIQAGGLGTRLYPYTKVLPKPLIPIGDVPIVEHIINNFSRAGCDEFYLIVNHKKNMIKSYFSETDKNYSIHFIEEDIPLGTGGGLSLLKGLIQQTFILTNCDILIDCDLSQIVELHKINGNLITMVCADKSIQIPYGVIETDENQKIVNMIEKPVLKYLTNTGMYLVEPAVIMEIESNKPMGFPDIFNDYRLKNKHIGFFTVDEAQWSDMGEIDKLNDMIAQFQ